MKKAIILFLLRVFAKTDRTPFYDSVNLTRSFADLEQEGVLVYGAGAVFENGDTVSGIYVVDYVPEILENKYGRYN